MEALLWIAAFGVGYSYFLYPLLLLLLPRRAQVRRALAEADLPSVTLIITAHNEEQRIETKLHNALRIDYPPERLEILVASDASTDATDSIVKGLGPQGVRLVRAEERLGKEHAQSLAIAAASGEILVFSDAGTDIPPESVRVLAEDFSDPRVGAVSSEDRFISQDGQIAGEGLYVRYEMWLRRLESSVNSLVGLSGSFFAVRREVCADWDTQVPSDFNSALSSVLKGYVAVTDPRVIGIYKDIKDPKREYQRKVRTVIRGITAVARQPVVLNPSRVGWFAVQVWSHKIMRWAVPWFLALLLLCNLAVMRQGLLYEALLAAQLAAYGLSVAGFLLPGLRRIALVKVPYFFCQVNLAMAHAALAFLLGRRVTVWTPSSR